VGLSVFIDSFAAVFEVLVVVKDGVTANRELGLKAIRAGSARCAELSVF